jgi:hypothetical protein
MKKLTLFIIALALAYTSLVSASLAGATARSAYAQEIDPAMIDGLTEAINNRNSAAVLGHFAPDATITFDNSSFNVPNNTITVAEYAARFRADNPDVPADVRMEVVASSAQISPTGATWTWRQTAGFLRDMGIDYIEFTVAATTEALKFKSLTIAPTKETIGKLPYSPPIPGSGPNPAPGMPNTGVVGISVGTMVAAGLSLLALGLAFRGVRTRWARNGS